MSIATKPRVCAADIAGIHKAAKLLRDWRLVAFPTETV
jgi:tRNA A37 threonylcarbamoyladenosine synthetase subunit TsaC/SUA5/YrdC